MAETTKSLGELQEIFRRFRKLESLTKSQLAYLSGVVLTPEQECAALVGLCANASSRPQSAALIRRLSEQYPDIAFLCGAQITNALVSDSFDQEESRNWQHALSAVARKQSIGAKALGKIILNVVSGDACNRRAAALMMAICIHGMTHDDVNVLTQLMASSGEQYDYRLDPGLKDARLIRRYPTGALSEKTALILPALIATAREAVNVASPFLVAKSLGHTGGTWDKLSTIPGFCFPQPGEESLKVLLECGIAMAVTHGNVNPADRKLYQLRSATETIESIPLIVTSIASKHLALPVHQLLLDVRVGDGAFLSSDLEGVAVGNEISRILRASGVATEFTITNSIQPNGSAIGNALEVAEAIAVMGGSSELWDRRGIAEQRSLVVHFFAKLMNAEFPQQTYEAWASYAAEKLAGNQVLEAFARILLAHDVAQETVYRLISNPFSALDIGEEFCNVYATSSGKLQRVHQFKLGGIVNRELGGGGNDFEGSFRPTAGVVLKYRHGDSIQNGDVICSVFSKDLPSTSILNDIGSCFEIQ